MFTRFFEKKKKKKKNLFARLKLRVIYFPPGKHFSQRKTNQKFPFQ